MFGANEVVGQKYFQDAGSKLLITSRFCTLQGEGPYSGLPAFFVRFAKCQLSCSFCDTYFDSGTWFTISEMVEEIDNEIRKFYEGWIPNWACLNPKRKMVLVVTGGEPTLQSNLLPFLAVMNQLFYHTQIETNGIIAPLVPDETTVVCSPKCLEGKSGKAIRYLEPNQETLKRADCLKFVMSGDLSSPYSQVPPWALEWRDQTNKEIYLSPMNIYQREPKKAKELRAQRQSGEITIQERSSVDEVISAWESGLLDIPAVRRNHSYTAQYCIKYGLRFNMQLHLFAELP